MFSFLDGLFTSLFSFLVCLIEFLVGSVEWVLVTVFNLLLAGLMALAGPALSLLPSISLPSISSGSGALETINYFFPLDTLFLLLGIVLPVWLLLPLIRLIFRWLKLGM